MSGRKFALTKVSGRYLGPSNDTWMLGGVIDLDYVAGLRDANRPHQRGRDVRARSAPSPNHAAKETK